MFKKTLLLTAIMVGTCMPQVFAQPIGVNDIQNLSQEHAAVAKNEEILSSNSYAFKTLKLLYNKYGGVMELPEDKFNGTKPLTRNEAALILVNLLGKVQNDKVQLSEADQTRIDALSDQLKKEIAMLTARVEKVETSVKALQDSQYDLEGRISDVEYSDSKKAAFSYGDKLKINGMFRGEFSTTFQSKAQSNFNLPLSQIAFSGKAMDHMNYFVLLNPYYGDYFADSKQLVDRAFIQTDILPKHKITLGKQPIPITEMASRFYSEMDTPDFLPQIGFLTYYHEPGLKVSGDFKYFKYQTGVFNRSVANSNNKGMAYVVNAVVKPLANNPKLGKLELGGSYYKSDKSAGYFAPAMLGSMASLALVDRSTNAFTAYGKYKLKDFEIESEYLHQTNAIDPFTNSMDSSNLKGFYIQPSYDLTPKTQLVARFDRLTNDTGSIGMGNQYFGGVNHFLKYPNLKLLTGLAYHDYNGQKSASKIMLQTQYLF